MSSNALTAEIGISNERANTVTIPSVPCGRTPSDVERRLLCARIEQLEGELARERCRRDQIVEQYERLLSEERERTAENGGWLPGLF